MSSWHKVWKDRYEACCAAYLLYMSALYVETPKLFHFKVYFRVRVAIFENNWPMQLLRSFGEGLKQVMHKASFY